MYTGNVISDKLCVALFVLVFVVLINHIKCVRNADNRKSLMIDLMRKQNVVTGYPYEPVWTEYQYMGCSTEGLQNWFGNMVRRLKCGYTMNAMHHLNLTKNLFRGTLNSRAIDVIAKYKEHVERMIGTLHESGDRSVNVMWLVNVYLSQLAEIVESLNDRNNVDTKTEILGIQELAIGRLMNSKRYLACEKYNKFERDLAFYKLAECQNPENQLECLDRVEQLVDENCKSVQELMEANIKCGFAVENKKTYAVDRLYLNDVVMDGKFTASLTTIFDAGIEMDAVCSNLKKKLRKAQSRPTNILKLVVVWSSIKMYQHMFFDTVTLIVLRMTRRCLIYMAQRLSNIGRCACPFLLIEKYAYSRRTLNRLLEDITSFFAMPNGVLRKISTKINRNELGRSLITFVEKEEIKIKQKYGQIIKFKRLKLNKSSRAELFGKLNDFGSEEKLHLSVVPRSRTRVPSKTRLCLMQMETFYRYLRQSRLFDHINFAAIHSFRSASDLE